MAAVYELNGDTLTVTTKTQAALLERLGYERQDTPKKAPDKKEPQYTEEEWNDWLAAEKEFEESQNPALTEEDLGGDSGDEKPAAPKRATRATRK